jgi:hypothetical protein
MKKNLFEKLIIAQPVNKSPASFETRRFITEFTTTHHRTLS